LRHVSGAQTGITVVRVNAHFNVVITGNNQGVCAVWDFEISTLKAYLTGHSEDITQILFIGVKPLVVTTGKDGLICIWNLNNYECLYRFQN
jgi:WD40 repeat protein